MLTKTLLRLNRASKRWIALASVALVIAIGIADFATGLELHVTLFYFLPIGMASWFVNRRAGILTAALCTLTWLMANYLGGRRYSSEWIGLWNFIMHLGISLVVAYILSQLRQAFDQVSELAGRDFLTGLPNGRAFYDLAGREMERAFGLEPITLAYIDIEGFKWINHRYGYATGDQMLCTIAHTIRENVPRPDLVGRIGGTAFAVLLPNATAEEARFVLEKILTRLKEERKRYAQPVTFFISAMACSKAPRRIAELMHEAELHMMRMKDGKRDALEIEIVDYLPALN
ncbi:MAG TPA: diguanylate cyclase [Candidatus Binatia bacterium]|nr:diguanylate cyclase [Candidatus Binatia bacterium]